MLDVKDLGSGLFAMEFGFCFVLSWDLVDLGSELKFCRCILWILNRVVPVLDAVHIVSGAGGGGPNAPRLTQLLGNI